MRCCASILVPFDGFDSSDFRCDDLEGCAGIVDRGLQALQERGVDAVGDDDTDFAAFERSRRIAQYAERRRVARAARSSAALRARLSGRLAGQVRPRPSAASDSSTLRSCETMRSRIAGFSTLLSSKT